MISSFPWGLLALRSHAVTHAVTHAARHLAHAARNLAHAAATHAATHAVTHAARHLAHAARTETRSSASTGITGGGHFFTRPRKCQHFRPRGHPLHHVSKEILTFLSPGASILLHVQANINIFAACGVHLITRLSKYCNFYHPGPPFDHTSKQLLQFSPPAASIGSYVQANIIIFVTWGAHLIARPIKCWRFQPLRRPFDNTSKQIFTFSSSGAFHRQHV